MSRKTQDPLVPFVGRYDCADIWETRYAYVKRCVTEAQNLQSRLASLLSEIQRDIDGLNTVHHLSLVCGKPKKKEKTIPGVSVKEEKKARRKVIAFPQKP